MESGALKRSRRWPLREQTSRKSVEVFSRLGRRVQRPSRWQRKRRKRTATATITTTRRACNQHHHHHHHLHRQQQALRLSSDYFPASRAPDQASSHTRGPNVASLARRLDGASSSWILLLLLLHASLSIPFERGHLFNNNVAFETGSYHGWMSGGSQRGNRGG